MGLFGKSLSGLAAISVVGVGLMASSTSAYAWRDHHGDDGWGYGGAAAAGLLGGLAIGTLASQPRYDPGYYRQGYYADEAPPPRCYVSRRRIYDEWGNSLGIRRVRICD